MKEQSQIDDMRAAIRGERERARERLRPGPAVDPPDDDTGNGLQPVPEPEEAPRPGLFGALFKRR